MLQQRPDGGYDLDLLIGLRVDEIRLAGIVKLQLDNDIVVDIERDFLIRSNASEAPTRVEFRPYDSTTPPRGMDVLASLFGARISAADATLDAYLRIYFEDTRTLEVPPDPRYEGWGIWHRDGWIGQPAGGGFRDERQEL